MAKESSKRERYKKEKEEIKRLGYLSNIIKRSDIENALLSNPSNESDAASEPRIDSMLEHIEAASTRGELESLDTIERLTTTKAHTAAVRKRAKAHVRMQSGTRHRMSSSAARGRRRTHARTSRRRGRHGGMKGKGRSGGR